MPHSRLSQRTACVDAMMPRTEECTEDRLTFWFQMKWKQTSSASTLHLETGVWGTMSGYFCSLFWFAISFPGDTGAKHKLWFWCACWNKQRSTSANNAHTHTHTDTNKSILRSANHSNNPHTNERSQCTWTRIEAFCRICFSLVCFVCLCVYVC